jgi:hypothetical protein
MLRSDKLDESTRISFLKRAEDARFGLIVLNTLYGMNRSAHGVGKRNLKEQKFAGKGE